MPRGSQPGERRGGRKKGSVNKRIKTVGEILAKSGGRDPFEFILNIMISEAPASADAITKLAWHQMRYDAAKTLLPYCRGKTPETKPAVDPNGTARSMREAQVAMEQATDGDDPTAEPEAPSAGPPSAS